MWTCALLLLVANVTVVVGLTRVRRGLADLRTLNRDGDRRRWPRR